MKSSNTICLGFLLLCFSLNGCSDKPDIREKAIKTRIIISTDIGGTDPDDFQSMIHFLMYANEFQTEGLISSPYGEGRKQDILDMLDLYEQDYVHLAQNAHFPTAQYLRSITKQGSTELAPFKGWSKASEGSNWIIKKAKERDEDLWILVWGGLEDVAQALHDAPEIIKKIKVYWIGGPNKKWSINAYAYIAEKHPDLWMIEANATYRGWFLDRESKEEISNKSFYKNFIAGKGQMGHAFKKYYGGEIKMGDSPSLTYLLDGTPHDPLSESWGGRFSPINHSSRFIFTGNSRLEDTVAAYATLEWRFQGPDQVIPQDSVCFSMEIWGQILPGYYCGNGVYCIRYSPKKPENGTYITRSAIPELDGLKGQYVSIIPWPGPENMDDYSLGDQWFSDRKEKDFFLVTQQGAKTISKHREAFLMDWAKRWKWLE